MLLNVGLSALTENSWQYSKIVSSSKLLCHSKYLMNMEILSIYFGKGGTTFKRVRLQYETLVVLKAMDISGSPGQRYTKKGSSCLNVDSSIMCKLSTFSWSFVT